MLYQLSQLGGTWFNESMRYIESTFIHFLSKPVMNGSIIMGLKNLSTERRQKLYMPPYRPQKYWLLPWTSQILHISYREQHSRTYVIKTVVYTSYTLERTNIKELGFGISIERNSERVFMSSGKKNLRYLLFTTPTYNNNNYL